MSTVEWMVGDRVKVGYFGQMRMGTVVKVGRTRLRVSVTMPSNRRVWVKWFPVAKCVKPGWRLPVLRRDEGAMTKGVVMMGVLISGLFTGCTQYVWRGGDGTALTFKRDAFECDLQTRGGVPAIATAYQATGSFQAVMAANAAQMNNISQQWAAIAVQEARYATCLELRGYRREPKE